MINCVIIDDEQHAIDLIKIHVEKIDYLRVLETFNNPVNAIEFLENNDVDVLFLDIEMPDISGLSFIKLLKKKIPVVVISAYKEYALEGFENEVLDYIVKPVSFERLLQATQRVLALSNSKSVAAPNAFIILKTDSKNKLLKIDLDDIIYIEGLKNYISVFTTQQRVISLLNIKSLEEKLPADRFIRTHKSYIISINKVKMVNGNQVFLKGLEQGIPISDSYKKQFFEIFRKNLIDNK
ncbi:LytR/AlgR family response regulator transcription factor [Mucilaginibacter sp. OK098]|uniref:LytR/AlgR family response regulator transcription factor n=1 Tax=Mucilaginibacter sp. OK098 TaxID=1855297 RepID=UPI000917A8B2|nr:LytTR family DNA-binding domain-containing protein [Mucilaginibacter sp. OK098]SHN33730.1 two component transcriptional regulator, LytTR family [Mucilaginibacter sp. OK098]